MSQTSELETKIKNWLNEQGYPLEMVVAQAIRRGGLLPQQSTYYTDIETGVPREIDVSARDNRGFTQGGDGVYEEIELRVAMSIECKSSGKPWLLFRSGEEQERNRWVSGRLGPTTTTRGKSFVQSMFAHELIQSCRIFQLHERIGYGLTQAFSSGDDIAYRAVMGSVKAAIAEVIRFEDGPDVGGPDLYVLISVAFPVIVLGGKLFECYLSEDENLIVSEITSAAVECKSPTLNRAGSDNRDMTTVVYIYTRSALEQLVSDFKEAVDVMEKGLPIYLEVHKSQLDHRTSRTSLPTEQ